MTLARLHTDPETLYHRAAAIDENPETWDLAERLYIEALRIDPSHAMSMTNIGGICHRRNDDACAAAWFHLALAVDPAQPEATYNLGYLKLAAPVPDLPGAIELLRAALRLDPAFLDAHFNLAMALERSKRSAEAQPHWRAYLARSTDTQWREIALRHLA